MISDLPYASVWPVERSLVPPELCDEQFCGRDGFECWLPDEDEPGSILCPDHAQRAGYCRGCGSFSGGIESFDFGRYAGWCDNCASEWEHEAAMDQLDEPDYWDEDLP